MKRNLQRIHMVTGDLIPSSAVILQNANDYRLASGINPQQVHATWDYSRVVDQGRNRDLCQRVHGENRGRRNQLVDGLRGQQRAVGNNSKQAYQHGPGSLAIPRQPAAATGCTTTTFLARAPVEAPNQHEQRTDKHRTGVRLRSVYGHVVDRYLPARQDFDPVDLRYRT